MCVIADVVLTEMGSEFLKAKSPLKVAAKSLKLHVRLHAYRVGTNI